MPSTATTTSSSTITPSYARSSAHGVRNAAASPPPLPSPPEGSTSRIPVTPAVLRAIFASSRTVLEERSLSRIAFFRFTGFLLSCLAISLAAARGRVIKNSAALLGVV